MAGRCRRAKLTSTMRFTMVSQRPSAEVPERTRSQHTLWGSTGADRVSRMLNQSERRERAAALVIVIDQRMHAGSELRVGGDGRRCHSHRPGAVVRAWSADSGESVSQGGSSTEGVPAKPQCGTTGLGLNQHRPRERRRHDLTPQIGAKRATGCSNGLHRSNSVEGINDCGKLQADALDGGRMNDSAMCPALQIGAGEIRVPQRCTFAEYIRQHQQALTAGGTCAAS